MKTIIEKINKCLGIGAKTGEDVQLKMERGKVLLVDDLVDSGLTFKRVTEHLRNNYKGITEVRTAVLWWKSCSQVEPDYYVEYLGDNPWIHQPFEVYDVMRLGQLVAKVEGHRKPE